MLNNHAPTVSLLKAGHVKIFGDISIEEDVKDKFVKGEKRGMWLPIDSGTIELKDNKIIVLAD
jgi:F-type H+-transporting ATPase subunit epsilon